MRAGQPECERKKWPSWLMRAARGVAWRALIRIVIRLIHSGREVGKSAAAAAAVVAAVVVVVVVASRGGATPAGRYTHVTCRVLYSPRRAPQLLVDAIAYAPEQAPPSDSLSQSKSRIYRVRQ